MRRKSILILVLVIALAAMLVLRGGDKEIEQQSELPVDGVVQMQEVAAVKAVKAGITVSLGTVEKLSEEGGVRILAKCEGESVAYAFEDVDLDSWYLQAVNYAVCGGLMQDIIDEGDVAAFAPARGVTRAQFAVTLYRFLGGEPAADSCSFEDLESDAWYYDAVNWAVQMGYLSGKEAENFGADEFLSCEQVLSVLHRLAGQTKSDVSLGEYPYAPKVSDYAKEAVAWAWSLGLIAEEEAIWYPTQTVSRAQLSLLLMRYDALTGGTITE